MNFKEREIIKEICNQIKILQEKGCEEEVVTFINCALNNAIKLKCSNNLINTLFIFKNLLELGYKL